MEDLSSRKIHVRENSSYHFSLHKLNEWLGSKNLAPVEIVALPGLVNTGEIIEMVNAVVIEITVADNLIAELAKELLPELKVYDQIFFNDDVKYGWMVRKNNPQLGESLNRFIKTVKKGTLLGNIFFNRYFKQNPWVREALKREDLDKLSQYAPLFRKYGEMYGFDWVLLAAQAFQESRFDAAARSRAGAVGLMQLLPSTAQDMGIDNIHLPENNVHAGVKYLKWIRENYFHQEQLSADDQVRLVLAAYNAGPGNIRKSQRATSEMGYDPFKWFGNCELGTMRQVGLEPIHYVRNINKYYLAFLISKVIMEVKQQELKGLKK